MTEKKTWTAWPEAKPQPLEETYVFKATARVELDWKQKRAIMRWLNATHPEQSAKEEEAFRRQEKGLDLFATEEEAEASRESDLVKAHYAFRGYSRFTVELEVDRDGSVKLLGPRLPSPGDPW